MCAVLLMGPTTALIGAPNASAAVHGATVAGFDISSSQGLPDFAAARSRGARFVYVHDTAGVGYANPRFLAQFRAVKAAGLLRGAYHYARPDKSSGVAQANYFHAHAGRWYADSATLPPVLDMENTDDAPACYKLSPAKMVAWIRAFSDRMAALSGHAPLLYTTASWWRTCTANSTAFAATNLLWLAHWGHTPGPTPGGWTHATIWQSGSTGRYPGDQDTFRGIPADLDHLTTG
jgi:GH25 family lysozyme M1 (1,4-beta-N-acetylmuramidase)